MSHDLFQKMRVTRADHLSVIAAFCHQMGLVESINHVVPTEMEVDAGTMVLALVLDTLSGRSPLYRLGDFYKHQDTNYLLGKELPSSALNDTTVGRTLDAIFDAGAEKVFNDVAFRAARIFPIDLEAVHFDTTSVNVWGAYDGCMNAEDLLNITHGYSKDHRPDLKQFLFKIVCAGGNIPIMGGCEDGNTSDKRVNNDVLTRLSKHMARFGKTMGSYIYVADSAFVTQDNLDAIENNLFITRLPFTYKETSELVTTAVQEEKWEAIGALNETKPPSKRPAAIYSVNEQKVTLYDKPYRAIVVHSTSHDKRRLRRMDREIKKTEKELTQLLTKEMKREYFCRADAESAVNRLKKSMPISHGLNAQVYERVRYKRGRPKKDESRKIESTHFMIQAELNVQEEYIAQKREESGCFVLLTNIPDQGEQAKNGASILKLYKEQHGIERNFSFLKDPVFVNDLFLKKPERVEALGAILLISLLVRNLIEFVLRNHIATTNRSLPGWDHKQTMRPTTFMMTTKFYGILILNYEGQRSFESPLTQEQKEYLVALKMKPQHILYPTGK